MAAATTVFVGDHGIKKVVVEVLLRNESSFGSSKYEATCDEIPKIPYNCGDPNTQLVMVKRMIINVVLLSM